MLKIKYSIFLLSILLLVFNGCSRYNISKTNNLKTLNHPKNITDLDMGSSSIPSPTYKKRYYLFYDIERISKMNYIQGRLSKYEWNFYEDSNDIYFFIKHHDFDYYSKRELKAYYTKEKLFGITKQFEIEQKNKKYVKEKHSDSINNKFTKKPYPSWWENTKQIKSLKNLTVLNNITCNSDKKICTIFSKKSNIILTIQFQQGKLFFEYIKYNKVKQNYLKALNTYDFNVVKHYKNTGIKPFLKINDFNEALKKASSIKDIDIVIKIAKLEDIKLSTQSIKIRKNQIAFNKKYNYYLTQANEKEIKQVLKNKKLLEGIDSKKIAKLKILEKKYEINRILKSNSTKTLLNYYNKTKNLKVKNKLLSIYKSQNTFNSNIELFKLTQEIKYLKISGKKAKTKKEELIVENLLLKTIPLKKLFKIQDISTSKKSEFHNLVGENLSFLQDISEISTSTKHLTKKFQLNANSKMAGNYKVKVNFVLETKMEAKTVNNSSWVGKLYNAIGKKAPIINKTTYSKIFYINENNNYQDIQDVKFKITGVSINALGIGIKSNIIDIKIKTNIVDVALMKK